MKVCSITLTIKFQKTTDLYMTLCKFRKKNYLHLKLYFQENSLLFWKYTDLDAFQ